MRIFEPAGLPPSSDPILDLLRRAKTIAVVGLSSNPARPSFEVASYLQSSGYRILPVNPNEREVLGVRAVARLEDIAEPVDIVDVFRRSEDVPPIAASAIAIVAHAFWLQLGIENTPACEQCRASGILSVEDSCLLVEHKKRRRLLAP